MLLVEKRCSNPLLDEEEALVEMVTVVSTILGHVHSSQRAMRREVHQPREVPDFRGRALARDSGMKEGYGSRGRDRVTVGHVAVLPSERGQLLHIVRSRGGAVGDHAPSLVWLHAGHSQTEERGERVFRLCFVQELGCFCDSIRSSKAKDGGKRSLEAKLAGELRK